MDEEYDCVVLGTGLKECILSGVLSVDQKKVLHMDKNNYYGGACASLNLDQLYEQFKKGEKVKGELGASRKYNVDLIPKFIMASGILVKILLHTDVTKYLEFKVVDGSYVFKGGKIAKVPATDGEALKSELMGLFEKRRAKNFFTFIQSYEAENPKTHQGFPDLSKVTMKAIFANFGLTDDTIDFIGHSLALHRDDSYLEQPANITVEKCKLYAESLARYGKSPYIYPLYGLGELPQGFARLSAIYGGTYMLNKPFEGAVYNEQGEIIGVKSEGEVAKCKFVVSDPSYFPEKVKKTGRVVRAICILGAPVPNTNNSASCQIIIPQKEAKRGSDIYISVVSSTHNVCDNGKFIATVSTTVETETPATELDAGIKLLGPVLEQFISIEDTFEPKEDGTKDKVFLTSSYDATSHFETTCIDVLNIYKRITGKDLDLTPKQK
jgi:Rab GDP dissociation inhibitor